MDVLVTELADKVNMAIVRQGYSQITLGAYSRVMRSLLDFFCLNQQKYYSLDLIKDFIRDSHNKRDAGVRGFCNAAFLTKRKMAKWFIEMHDNGNIKPICNLSPFEVREVTPNFVRIIEKFKQGDFASLYRKSTITNAMYSAKKFIFFLEDKGYVSLKEVNRSDVSEYFLTLSGLQPSSLRAELYKLRLFFRFLSNEGMIDNKLVETLSIPIPHCYKVRFGFTREETEILATSTDENTIIGKRDHAILRILQNTGLRSVDVRNLKLGDIDWKNNEIKIVQSKTQTPLILPICISVKDAIADYILNYRPKNDEKTIFLRTRPPFLPLSRSSIYQITKTSISRSGIALMLADTKGTHNFRRSLGASMLNENISLQTMREVFGQKNLQSVKPYVATDINHLRSCPLPITNFLCKRAELVY